MFTVEKTVIEAFRGNVFGLLDNIARGGVRFPASLEEYLCMWFRDLWWDPEGLIRDGAFSDAERKVLDRFGDAFRAAYPKGETLNEVNTYKLQSDPTWLSVVRAAKEAKAELERLASNGAD